MQSVVAALERWTCAPSAPRCHAAFVVARAYAIFVASVLYKLRGYPSNLMISIKLYVRLLIKRENLELSEVK